MITGINATRQRLDPFRDRVLPGMLGPHRVLDTVTAVGMIFPEVATQFQLPTEPGR